MHLHRPRRLKAHLPPQTVCRVLVRPYWLVTDIQAALDAATDKGATIAHPPLEIPGKGTFAIYIQGGVHHGLWQL